MASRVVRLEGGAVPGSEGGGRFVGALEEGQQGRFGIGGRAHVRVGEQVLAELGVSEREIHTELFHVTEEPPPPRPPDEVAGEAEVTILLDGRTSTFRMGRDERVLDAALKVRPELPYACRGGVCSTCRARLVDGEVQMARNYALEPDELAAGYVLTCQSSPLTEHLTVDYDG